MKTLLRWLLVLAFVGLTTSAEAAIAVVGSVDHATATGTTPITLSHNVGAGTNCLIVMVTTGDGDLDTRTIDTLTFNGTSMTLLAGSASDDANFLRAEIWYQLAPAATTANIVASNLIGSSKW